jgi:hypothetical protein
VTPGVLAMLAGVFGVPAALLWAGHRLRRRSARWRAAFWGALAAHAVVAPVAMLAAILPPAAWAPDDRWRGFLGFWAPLAGPLIGAALAAARVPRRLPSQRGAGATSTGEPVEAD